jgi:RNA polymerase sigma factor (sigma-70 family)
MQADVAPLWVQGPAPGEIGPDVGGQVAAADGAGGPDGTPGDSAGVAATAGAFGVDPVGAAGHGAVAGLALGSRSFDHVDGFDDFYRAHYESLVRLGYLLTLSEDVARDLVHDVFVRVYRRFEGLEEPLPYLRRCVVNASRSWHRRRQLEWTRSRVERVPDVAFEADELFDVLARLPSRQRAAIVLRFYEQMSDAEIAALLHCRPGTVASLVHRGCARLRTAISEPEGEP